MPLSVTSKSKWGVKPHIRDVKIKIRYHGWVMTVKKMPKRAGHISSGYIPSYFSPYWSFSKPR